METILLPKFKMASTKRRAFCKEFKLKVINWYFENEENFNQTANNLVRNWLKDEEKIRCLNCSRKSCRYGKAKFLFMEKEPYSKFLDMRKESKCIKRWWLNSKVRELVTEKYSE